MANQEEDKKRRLIPWGNKSSKNPESTLEKPSPPAESPDPTQTTDPPAEQKKSGLLSRFGFSSKQEQTAVSSEPAPTIQSTPSAAPNDQGAKDLSPTEAITSDPPAPTAEKEEKKGLLSRFGVGPKDNDKTGEDAPAPIESVSRQTANLERNETAQVVAPQDRTATDQSPPGTEDTTDHVGREGPEENKGLLARFGARSKEDSKQADEGQQETQESKDKKPGFFSRLKSGLTRSSNKLSEGVTGIFTKRKLDDDTLEELEDLLISSDLGVVTAAKISSSLAEGRYDKEIAPEEVRKVLADEIVKVLGPTETPLVISQTSKPFVILMVGVNGSGKTTTIGKIAAKQKAEGKSCVLAAGDTFRAAAIEQLKIWGERTDNPVIAKDIGADAAGLAYEAIEEARQNSSDIVLIDTAGRLQNKANLMAELEKIVRVIKKLDPTAPHAVLLTLDATTGQNAVSQVEAFKDTAGVTGLVMTKLDGTARGGILVAIAEKFALPVHFIGVGEGIDDLQEFKAEAFAQALVGAATPETQESGRQSHEESQLFPQA